MTNIEDQVRAYAQAISVRPEAGDVGALSLLPQGEAEQGHGLGRIRWLAAAAAVAVLATTGVIVGGRDGSDDPTESKATTVEETDEQTDGSSTSTSSTLVLSTTTSVAGAPGIETSGVTTSSPDGGLPVWPGQDDVLLVPDETTTTTTTPPRRHADGRLILPYVPGMPASEPGRAGVGAAVAMPWEDYVDVDGKGWGVQPGATIGAYVFVDNGTGAWLEVPDCGGVFLPMILSVNLALGSPDYLGWDYPVCDTTALIPPGQSTWPIPIDAVYPWCGPVQPLSMYPECLPDGSSPNLAPGSYTVFARSGMPGVFGEGNGRIFIPEPG